MQNQTYGDFYLFTGDAKNGGGFAAYQLYNRLTAPKFRFNFRF